MEFRRFVLRGRLLRAALPQEPQTLGASFQASAMNSPTQTEPVIDGQRLYLRRIRASDADGPYLGWMNDPEVTRLTASWSKTFTAESLRRYIEETTAEQGDLFLAIVIRDGDRQIGNIKLKRIDGADGRASIGIIIGEKGCWGRGYATEAISILSDHAFGTLGLEKLTAGCFHGNIGSEKAFKKAGFIVEEILRDNDYIDGRQVDEIRVAKLNPEYSMESPS